MLPSFSFDELDIISDRRPIRKLYGFVTGDPGAFEFGVEIVGSTALFIRIEKQTRDVPGGYQGYRRTFEENYTKIARAALGSTSHHRIIRYDFGGLQCLVRSAVDAFIRSAEELLSPDLDPVTDSGDLVSYMKATSLGAQAPSLDMQPTAPGVSVVKGGIVVPRKCCLELKTRSKFAKYPWDIEQKLPDLWISQTQTFVVASHQHWGTKWASPRLAIFSSKDIRVKSMHGELFAWERKNAAALEKLRHVLSEVIQAAKEINAPCIVGFDGDKKTLLVRKVEKGTMLGLSNDLRKKWSAGGDGLTVDPITAKDDVHVPCAEKGINK